MTKTKGIFILIVFGLIGYFGKINLYPCKIIPVVLNPIPKWSLCQMDIFHRMYIVGVSERYFGVAQGWVIALILNLMIAWLIVSLVIYLYKKYKK